MTAVRQRLTFDVGVEWSEAPLHVAAWLTVPDTLARPELHLLVPGATYNHAYWDWLGAGGPSSTVQQLADRGLASLAIDRIGTGQSSRPPGGLVDVALHAQSIQAIMAAATSGLGPHSFGRFTLIGHSLGSIVSVSAALSAPGQIRALVLTGILVASGTGGRPEDIRAALSPSAAQGPATTAWIRAQDHPGLAGLGAGDGYLTTRPDQRLAMFYWPAQTDPAIAGRDGQQPDTMTTGEARSLVESPNTGLPALPILWVVGQYDTLLYNPAKQPDVSGRVERRQASAAASEEFAVIHDTGHNLALHQTAPQSTGLIIDWLLGLAS